MYYSSLKWTRDIFLSYDNFADITEGIIEHNYRGVLNSSPVIQFDSVVINFPIFTCFLGGSYNNNILVERFEQWFQVSSSEGSQHSSYHIRHGNTGFDTVAAGEIMPHLSLQSLLTLLTSYLIFLSGNTVRCH